MLDWLITLLTGHGSYLGIVVFLVLTGCGLPIPEEVPIITAGLLSAKGVLDPWLAFGSCLIGAILGDCVMYAIGYHWGHNLLKLHPRLGHWLHAEREEKFEYMIERHGLKVLLAARFMVGVRSPVYLSAGVLRVPFRRFLLMDMLCATLVVGVFFGLTFAFGAQIASWIRQAEIGLTVVVLLALAGSLLWFYRRGRKRLERLEAVQNRRLEKAHQRANRAAGSHEQNVA